MPTPIDGNIIYGADESTNQQIRDSNSLKFAKDEFGLSIIGDVRSQQTAGFFMFNELFTNLHDMIVTKLEDYEQARKFVSGTMQKILFDLLADALGNQSSVRIILFTNVFKCFRSYFDRKILNQRIRSPQSSGLLRP